MPIQEGQIIAGEFRVAKVLQGGFSQVLIVEDGRGLMRAIKCIREDRWQNVPDEKKAEASEQFTNECYIWQTKLKECPYVAEAHLAFRNFDNLGPVLFMEMVDGPSLHRLRQGQGHLSVRQTLRVASQIAKAMAFAHKQGVLHRDLTPSNVLLTRSNEVKLVDWGLCSARGMAGYDAYTPGYASPQREATSSLADPNDDVFAFGSIIHDCLTGNLPVRGNWTDSEIRSPLTATQPFLPDELVGIVVGALQYDPAKRPNFNDIVRTLSSDSFLSDVQKREQEAPFCKQCQFVSVSPIQKCPVCGSGLWRRIPHPPRGGMIRIEASLFVHGLTRVQVQNAVQAAGMKVPPEQIDELVADGQRSVFLPAFDIDKFSVTNAQFDAFCKAVNYPEPQNFAAKKIAFPNHPVVNITWKDALCYALWAGKRLPSPLEWEKAARGDQDTRPYPWGENWDERRCNNARSFVQTETTEVGAFTQGNRDGQSPFGVADMVGNVREWVVEGKSHNLRGLRGGSWNDACIIEGLVSYQIDAEVGYHDAATGFRCAADVIYDEVPLDQDGNLEDDT